MPYIQTFPMFLSLLKVWFPTSFSLLLLNIEIPIITIIVSQYNTGASLTIFGFALSIIIAVNGAISAITPTVISIVDSNEDLKKVKKYFFFGVLSSPYYIHFYFFLRLKNMYFIY